MRALTDHEPDPDPVALPFDQRSVVLVGLMGVGKTTIGRRLAAALHLPFVDADHENEDAAGCSIPEIFARYGEDAFRDGERRVIARLLEGPRRVLATGGGAFMNEETRRRISRRGVSVWLKADLDLLMDRVGRKSNRPLLDNDDPRGTMQRLIEQRYPIYAQADITVESREGPHDRMVRAIIQSLKKAGALVGEAT